MLEGVEPVTKVTSVVAGGLVTFKMFTVKVLAGLAQEPFIAFTLICPPDKPIDTVISFVVDDPVQLLGKVQT